MCIRDRARVVAQARSSPRATVLGHDGAMSDPSSHSRFEHDSMGEMEVPADALWGAHTARAVANFPISGLSMPLSIIHALAQVKSAAARVNADLSRLDPDIARAIAVAADDVAGGLHDDQFPVDVFQTGSGTSTNMNMNEVVARVAHVATGTAVHPNDHVNAGQSSNDTFPTAVTLAAVVQITSMLLPAITELTASLDAAAQRFSNVVKAGRTHMMDAVPIFLGDEFDGYAAQLREASDRIHSGLP